MDEVGSAGHGLALWFSNKECFEGGSWFAFISRGFATEDVILDNLEEEPNDDNIYRAYETTSEPLYDGCIEGVSQFLWRQKSWA
ncbi:unnamed protein product [Cochlearia groenlandica]